MTRKQVIINCISVAQHGMKDLIEAGGLTTECVLRYQGYFKHCFNHLEQMLERKPELRTKDEDVAKAVFKFEQDCNELFYSVKRDYEENPESGAAEHNYNMMRRWMNYDAYKAKAFADVFLGF